MVVIFIVGIAIGVGGKDVLKGGGLVGKPVGAAGCPPCPGSGTTAGTGGSEEAFDELSEEEQKEKEEQKQKKKGDTEQSEITLPGLKGAFDEFDKEGQKHLEEKGDTEQSEIILPGLKKGLLLAKEVLENLESNLEKEKNFVKKNRIKSSILQQKRIIGNLKLQIEKAEEKSPEDSTGGTGSTGSEGNIGETGGTTGTDTSGDYEIPEDYSDTPDYEGDNTVVKYQVSDNDGNLVWTGSDMQTYYKEHSEKNPCGEDGENTYGWYFSGNEDYGSICSTGPDTSSTYTS
jgi:hypothetical protein